LTGNSLDVLAGYAKRFGSPAYIYDLAEVRASHALLRAAVPESVEVAYSLKANPHPALVRTLGELGCALEVSSVGELAVASPTGRPLIFTGPGKSDLDLEAAIRAECVLSVESPAELPRVDEIAGRLGVDAGRVQVILRINPDFGSLCTPLDVLNLRAMLPEGLAIGDVMAIPNVGAHGLTASLLGFLSRDLPCEIVVDGGRLIEATRLTLTRAACEEN
jgi:diaminopimelate decarboxylase